MNTLARVGFLASPPLVGGVADAAGLRTAFTVLLLPAALVLIAGASALAPAQTARHDD